MQDNLCVRVLAVSAAALLALAGLCAAAPTVAVANSQPQLPFRLLGNFSYPHPSFISLQDHVVPGQTKTAMLLTQFSGNPFSSGKVSYVEDIGGKLSDVHSITPLDFDTGRLKWPNEVSTVPHGAVAGLQDGVIVPDGFLVPGKSTGSLRLMGVDASNWSQDVVNKISTDKSGYFYHMAAWRDMNGDGRLDVLTARATKPLFGGSGHGELLWLEQPASGAMSGPWKEHVLCPGPSVLILDMDGGPTPDVAFQVFATEFFVQKFTVTYIGHDGTCLRTEVIDDTIGPAYTLVKADLNGDGKSELVVSNHQDDAAKSGVWAYEIPTDFDPTKFRRHQLATGFKVTEPGSNQAAPGFAYPVYLRANHTATDRPTILIAGDGSQSAYVLYPTDVDWKYDMHTIVDVNGVVGSIAYGDVDGDSYLDFFVPDYDHGVVYAYTFAPH